MRFNRARRAERDLSEMLGLVKGILVDGIVNEAEAEHLRNRAAHHPDAVEQWPVNIVKARLDHIFADGHVHEAERRDLSALLQSVVGGTAGVLVGEDAATELPLDTPPPAMVWRGSLFVFTGKFAFGTRQDCQRHVIRLGAASAPSSHPIWTQDRASGEVPCFRGQIGHRGGGALVNLAGGRSRREVSRTVPP